MDQAWLWTGFNLFVLLMLALDLGVFQRNSHVVSMKEALGWCAVWGTLALAFGGGVWHFRGPELGQQFLASYLIELCLSVDNVFVFVVSFSYFAVPAKYQHRVLFFGILGALVFLPGRLAHTRVPFDWTGMLLLTASITALLVGLTRGERDGGAVGEMVAEGREEIEETEEEEEIEGRVERTFLGHEGAVEQFVEEAEEEAGLDLERAGRVVAGVGGFERGEKSRPNRGREEHEEETGPREGGECGEAMTQGSSGREKDAGTGEIEAE